MVALTLAESRTEEDAINSHSVGPNPRRAKRLLYFIKEMSKFTEPFLPPFDSEVLASKPVGAA